MDHYLDGFGELSCCKAADAGNCHRRTGDVDRSTDEHFADLRPKMRGLCTKSLSWPQNSLPQMRGGAKRQGGADQRNDFTEQHHPIRGCPSAFPSSTEERSLLGSCLFVQRRMG